MLRVVVHVLNFCLMRPRQGNLCELEASLVYTTSNRPARATQGDLVKQTNKE